MASTPTLSAAGPATTSARDQASGADWRLVLSDRTCRMTAAGCLLWVVVYAGLTAISRGHAAFELFVGDIVYLVPLAVCAVAAFAAGRRLRGRDARMWQILTAAFAAQFVGEAVWAGYDYLTAEGAPAPSWADVFYLSASVLTVCGVLAGFGSAGLLRHLRGLLDVLLIVVSFGALGWLTLVRPQLGPGVAAADAVNVAYPLLDVMLLSCVAIVGLGGHRRLPWPVRLVTLAGFTNAVSDMVYTYLAVFGEYDAGSWVNVGFQTGAVLFTLAAVVAVRRPEPPAQRRTFDRGLALMPIGLAMAVTIALVAFDKTQTGDVDNATLGVAAVLFGTVLLRQYLFTVDRAALARELHEALLEQRRLAVTDGLTGLSNRRYLTTVLGSQDPAVVGGGPIALLVIDLDHFKRINDTYGHLAGDDVLCEAADRIRRAARSQDLVVRYGGEEFVVVLPDTEPHTAVQIAERIRSVLRDTPMSTGSGTGITVSTSVGVAAATDCRGLPTLLAAADAALYRAKQTGRDRVVGPLTAHPPAGDHPGVPGRGSLEYRS